jgi:FGGY-family pentulose kinase
VKIKIKLPKVRAGIVNTKNGKLISSHSEEIQTWNPLPLHYEQSSNNIWNSITKSIHKILEKTQIPKEEIIGIGFDATCSLVVIDSKTNEPLSVSTSKNKEQNIILWMDHRSIEQTNKINETKNEVLKFVGDTISPEMETPKLLWIKENLKELYLKEDVKFFDLADWLVYKSTGHDVRSICTLVSKWTFLSHKLENGGNGWNDDYFKEVGLELETKLNYKRIGNKFKNVGEPIGNGITKEIAKELNLNEGMVVASGIIDAHCGGVGILGSLPFKNVEELSERLCLIGGTSSCLM